MAQDAKRFVCSSLLVQAFLFVGHPIAASQARDVLPGDFESAPLGRVVPDDIFVGSQCPLMAVRSRSNDRFGAAPACRRRDFYTAGSGFEFRSGSSVGSE